MSLSEEQKKDLSTLGDFFRKIEKISVENKIDLDVFMSEYNEYGYAGDATEKVALNPTAEVRQDVFKKSEKEKTKKSTVKSH